MALLCFDPKKCSCDPPIKIFPIFALDSIRPYLDWALRIFDLLTHLQPFQIWLEMKTKVQNWTKMSICHRTASHKKIWNVPLDALICPLQIINWHWTPIIHGVNTCFIHHPSNVKNYSISHKLETSQPKKKKVGWENIFLHLYSGFGVKIQNSHHYRNSATFLTSWQSALNGPANSPEVTYSKIQDRLRRAP